MLNYIKERAQHDDPILPIEEEWRFLEVIKLIIMNGWIIKESDFLDVLDIIEIHTLDKADYKQALHFFMYFIDLMWFDHDNFLNYLDTAGIDMDQVMEDFEWKVHH